MTRPRLSLFRQGIWLTLLPGIVQIVVVACVAMALFHEQRASLMESDSRNLVLALSQFDKEASDAITATFLCVESRGLIRPSLALKAMDRVEKYLRAVEESAANNADQASKIRDLRRRSEAILQTCKKIIEESGPLQSESTMQKYQKHMLREVNDAAIVSREIADIEDKALASLFEARRGWHDAVRVGLCIALLSSLATCVVIGRRYFRKMAQKIRHLADNARRLSRRDLLLPPLPGDDDFAFLDRVLRDVDNELTQAIARENDSFENAAELIFVLDENRCFKRTNAAAKKFLGIDAADLIGRALVSFMAPTSKETAEQALTAATRQGATTSAFEASLINQSDDSPSALPVLILLCFSADEKSFYCTALDLTERKRTQSLKERFNKMLRERLIGPLEEVRHDAHEILTDKDAVPAAAAEDLQSIIRNLNRLVTLADSLNDLGRLSTAVQPITSGMVAVDQIVAAARDSLQAIAVSHNVEVTYVPADLIVTGDQEQLARVLTNLISNAIKFSPDDSTIAVKAEDLGDSARISVTDRGPGIADNLKERIFLPFVQGAAPTNNMKGTGLGLAICASIVEAHGGSYGVDSQINRGSTFWFTIPLVPVPSVKDGIAQQETLG